MQVVTPQCADGVSRGSQVAWASSESTHPTHTPASAFRQATAALAAVRYDWRPILTAELTVGVHIDPSRAHQHALRVDHSRLSCQIQAARLTNSDDEVPVDSDVAMKRGGARPIVHMAVLDEQCGVDGHADGLASVYAFVQPAHAQLYCARVYVRTYRSRLSTDKCTRVYHSPLRSIV